MVPDVCVLVAPDGPHVRRVAGDDDGAVRDGSFVYGAREDGVVVCVRGGRRLGRGGRRPGRVRGRLPVVLVGVARSRLRRKRMESWRALGVCRRVVWGLRRRGTGRGWEWALVQWSTEGVAPGLSRGVVPQVSLRMVGPRPGGWGPGRGRTSPPSPSRLARTPGRRRRGHGPLVVVVVRGSCVPVPLGPLGLPGALGLTRGWVGPLARAVRVVRRARHRRPRGRGRRRVRSERVRTL